MNPYGQDNYDKFCNSLVAQTIDRICEYAGEDELMCNNTIWNIAEMMLLDAIRHTHKIGGYRLAALNLHTFAERMQEHCKELGTGFLH